MTTSLSAWNSAPTGRDRPKETLGAHADPTPDGGLAATLKQVVSGEVRFSDGDRHLYATDASNFRQIPIGVVVPRTLDDVVSTVEVCRQFDAPITHRGGGTSLAGQATNAAVIIDHSKYLDAILDIDPEAATATVETGIVLDTLRTATGDHGLTWGPDPSTHNRCTVGGMIGNNACGIHAYAYGRVEDNVAELDVLLYDGTRITVGNDEEDDLDDIIAAGGRKGEIYAQLRDLRDRYADEIRERFPDIPRRVSGFNLPELLPENGFNVARALVGTEGTCVTVLTATVELNQTYPERCLLVLGYPDVYAAGDHVGMIRRESEAIALEGLDTHLIRNMREKHLHDDAIKYLPDGGGWLLVEFAGATRDEAETSARELMGLLAGGHDPPTMKLYDDEDEEEVVWSAREAGLGATAHFKGQDHWPGWEDSAVAPDDVGDYLRDLRELFEDYGLSVAVYGHFGDGCIHCRIGFDLSSHDGVEHYKAFLSDAAELTSSYGGSYSGEHGDGQQRGPLLEQMYGTDIVRAFGEFKTIFDPDNKMNPGKVVDSYAVDENLRLGADHRQWQPETKFAYTSDKFDFNRAQLRCVGVGKCRRDDGAGTMCPSYMVTHEEMHSTRGRARLLFEMLEDDSKLDGWRDETVKEALDLCLSCKGCVTDCPVDVDIPTYKAEFLYHHYEGRVHPRVDYAMGLINVWSRLASFMPGLANTALNLPGISTLLKKIAGVATQRPAPTYAGQTFREWFDQQDTRAVPPRPRHSRPREVRSADMPRVILFPDTFTNYFHPAVGKATVSVLEDAGYQVSLPPSVVCCGRPLYDYGMLDLAESYLDRLIDQLRDDVAAGAKIVGMEPSCVAVFCDELVELKPRDADARRIADNTYTLAEFLVEVADYSFPHLQREAIVHGHCHHRGVMGLSADERALDRLGLDWKELDAGCCGLAGSFGFEAGESFDVSVRAGERKLLPAVRDADPNTLVIADGFSCRTQIQQLQQINGTDGGPGRRGLHLAQIIQMARDEGPVGPPLDRETVESGYVSADGNAWFTTKDAKVAALGAAGLVVTGLGWWAASGRRS